MRVMMVSKALVVAAYQRKVRELARAPDVQMVAVVPPGWRQPGSPQPLEPTYPEGYELVVSPIVFNGRFHVFFFPHLGALLDQYRPDLLHIDEEPYNLATFLAGLAADRRSIPWLFFSWQNLVRRYPLPFRWMERSVYRRAAWAIAGTESAARVLRAKGYGGRAAVIPQFGIDPEQFAPSPDPGPRRSDPLRIGFVGRLAPEKGVDVLLQACARLPLDLRVCVVGAGPEAARLRGLAEGLGIAARVEFQGPVPSAQMPEVLRGLDVLVLPSVSRPHWTEQFGRALVEAMACGVPVVGSTCGEIPSVIGDAGLVFPEGDSAALAAHLERLGQDPKLRQELAARGRERALRHYTHERIARETIVVYRAALSARRPPEPRSPPEP